jgi:hypothetical protein
MFENKAIVIILSLSYHDQCFADGFLPALFEALPVESAFDEPGVRACASQPQTHRVARFSSDNDDRSSSSSPQKSSDLFKGNRSRSSLVSPSRPMFLPPSSPSGPLYDEVAAMSISSSNGPNYEYSIVHTDYQRFHSGGTEEDMTMDLPDDFELPGAELNGGYDFLNTLKRETNDVSFRSNKSKASTVMDPEYETINENPNETASTVVSSRSIHQRAEQMSAMDGEYEIISDTPTPSTKFTPVSKKNDIRIPKKAQSNNHMGQEESTYSKLQKS